MLANDTTGDCTIAAVGHAVALWRSYEPPPMTFMTDAEALAAYAKVMQPGGGAFIADVLNYWKTQGFIIGGKLDKLSGWNTSDWKDHQAVIDAVDKGGCVICGVILRNGQDLPGPEQFGPWKTINDQIAGGHCVLIVKVTDVGPVCVTWGTLVQITWDWWDAR
jgi:hypothetical protein